MKSYILFLDPKDTIARIPSVSFDHLKKEIKNFIEKFDFILNKGTKIILLERKPFDTDCRVVEQELPRDSVIHTFRKESDEEWAKVIYDWTLKQKKVEIIKAAFITPAMSCNEIDTKKIKTFTCSYYHMLTWEDVNRIQQWLFN